MCIGIQILFWGENIQLLLVPLLGLWSPTGVRRPALLWSDREPQQMSVHTWAVAQRTGWTQRQGLPEHQKLLRSEMAEGRLLSPPSPVTYPVRHPIIIPGGVSVCVQVSQVPPDFRSRNIPGELRKPRKAGMTEPFTMNPWWWKHY